MKLHEMLLAEFDQEAALTRQFLERVPEDKIDFRAHEKSMSLGEIATHLAQLPFFVTTTLTADHFDIAGPRPSPKEVLRSSQSLLAVFDAHVAEAKAALATTNEAELEKLWSLKMGDTVFFTLPRFVVLRSFALSHTVHHRAQLGVNFRLAGIPVPQCYGPTADEMIAMG